MASILVSEVTHNSITVQLTELDENYGSDDRYVVYYLNNSATIDDNDTSDPIYLDAGISEGGEWTFYNLNSNTYYTIDAEVTYSGGTVWLSTTAKTLTEPETPSYTINSIVKTSGNIAVSITNNKSSDYSFYIGIGYLLSVSKDLIQFFTDEGGTIEGNSTKVINVDISDSRFFGRILYLAVRIFKDDGSGYEYYYPTRSTGSQTIGGRVFKNTSINDYDEVYSKALILDIVFNWNWKSSNVNATIIQTKSAYTAITRKEYLSDFSYLVWNDLCDKTNEALIEVGGSWKTKSGKTLAEDKISDDDTTLTAVRFNDLMYNIKRPLEHSFEYDTSNYATNFPHLVDDVIKGGPVYGDHFIEIAKLLNVFIGKINGS